MSKQVFVALMLGALFASSIASCVTCPAGQQSCGDANNNSNTSAGSSGDDQSATCGLLTAFKRCMTDYCANTENPFCTCYKRGKDITTDGCKCIDFDPKKFCANANNDDGSGYDCAAASSGVSSFCVPVR